MRVPPVVVAIICISVGDSSQGELSMERISVETRAFDCV